MRKLASRWRLLAALVPVAAFIALMVGTSANGPGTVSAATSAVTSVTCTQFFLDLNNNGIAEGGTNEDLNGDTVINDSDISAIAISRLEPNGGSWDLTSILYIGPDTPADTETLVPNEPPDQSCSAARTEATGGAEVSNHNVRQEFVNQFGSRPGTPVATQTGKVLTTRTCGFSEALGTWVRQDSFVTIATTGPTSINDVDAVLYLATDAPDQGGESGVTGPDGNSAVNPLDCGTGSAFAYNTVGKSYGRDARTDNPTEAQNATLSIAADPSGTSGPDTADGLQDDYDGDGCTDWDELDNLFAYSYSAPTSGGTNPQRGMDPFNPYDCDANVNSNISMLMRVAKDAHGTSCTLAQVVGGTCVGDGAYFQCLGKIDHTKTGTAQPLAFKLACYPDSTVQVINDAYPGAGGNDTCGPAPAAYCGDGRAGPQPPGANRYISVLSANWPIPATGSYDTATGQISVGGCFVGLGGTAFGPNVYSSGTIDLRTGAGEMDLFGHINDVTDCNNGPPFPSQSPVLNLLDVEIDFVEIGNKAAAHDSDSDGCSDTEELGTDEQLGGKRDPFNEGDWFDPSGDGTVSLFDDILAISFKFGTSAPGPPSPGPNDYDPAYDRGDAVPGSNIWNIEPANGTIGLFDDIFGAAFQFGHSC